jgi:glutamate dehydrogenase
MESVETLADHIESLYGSKVIAHSSHQDYLEIRLEKETEVGSLRFDRLRRT